MKNLRTLIPLFLLILSGCGAAPATETKPPKTREALEFKNTVVSLTFDDGDADNYAVRSVLAENKLHATFYIVSGFTGTDGYMTLEQLRGLYEDGNEIGGHTVNHAELAQIRGDELRREVCQNRADLTANGFDVTSFAYPFGHYDDVAKQTVEDCGYNNARVVTGGPELTSPPDVFALRAMPYIVKDTRLPKMLRYVTQTESDGGGWVIFVFHHVCDKCDQYSIELSVFTEFAQWLNERQADGLVVKTIGEVVGGEVQPVVAP